MQLVYNKAATFHLCQVESNSLIISIMTHYSVQILETELHSIRLIKFFYHLRKINQFQRDITEVKSFAL